MLKYEKYAVNITIFCFHLSRHKSPKTSGYVQTTTSAMNNNLTFAKTQTRTEHATSHVNAQKTGIKKCYITMTQQNTNAIMPEQY